MNNLVHGYRCEPIFGGDPLAFSGNFGGSDDCPLVLRGENLALNLWKGHRRYRKDRVDLHSGLHEIERQSYDVSSLFNSGPSNDVSIRLARQAAFTQKGHPQNSRGQKRESSWPERDRIDNRRQD